MEWLFLTCHNYWIVCRLVKDDDHPFLAYSPMISIESSSVPFRALLGAILSVVETVPVEPSEFSPDMEFDQIDGSESGYAVSLKKGMANDPPNSHNRHYTGQKEAEFGLMVCPCLAFEDNDVGVIILDSCD